MASTAPGGITKGFMAVISSVDTATTAGKPVSRVEEGRFDADFRDHDRADVPVTNPVSPRLFPVDGVNQRALPVDFPRDDRLRAVHAYWQARRGAHGMPGRADIRPEDLSHSLGWINLIDVRPRMPVFRFRLVGTDIVQAYGRDVTGRGVRDLTPPDYAELIHAAFAEAVRQRRPVLHELRFSDGWKTHAMRRLTLPLTSDGGAVDMLMTVASLPPALHRHRAPNGPRSGI